MLALIQRVSSAFVEVDNKSIGRIGKGLLVFLGIEKDDTRENADLLLKKILAYRVFSDHEDKMNLSVCDIEGGLLIVSQFTLAADTSSGLRPSFSAAKNPQEAETLYHYFVGQAESRHPDVACGEFAADMQVSLVNDGPATFLLKS
tara:strand:+ start:1675 stop:2112 length:438 start_codon:yes stop_codon:yes gene_type:complete